MLEARFGTNWKEEGHKNGQTFSCKTRNRSLVTFHTLQAISKGSALPCKRSLGGGDSASRSWIRHLKSNISM